MQIVSSIQGAVTLSIRWGIIGCGDVTEVKSGPGFQRAEGSELVAVMRRNGDLAADFARRHRIPKWYDDADALINDPEVDAVSIATPPGSHLELALKVCAAGKPAYIEKPMARTHLECCQINSAFEKVGVPLFVAFYRRALPLFVKAKEIVESGRIGRVTGVSYQFASPSHLRTDPENLPWRFDAELAGGGLFMDLGCHTLDILDFILGPLQDVSGSAKHQAAPYLVEDSLVMTFQTRSGGMGTASWNFSSFERDDAIEISGTLGRLSFTTFSAEPLKLVTATKSVAFDYSEDHVIRAQVYANAPSRTELFDLPNPPHIQQPLIQSVVNELRGGEKSPSNGVTAARTAKVMDSVLTSYYKGREDEFWLRPETWGGNSKP